MTQFKLIDSYNVCVIDVGSPKLGNLGWSFIDTKASKEYEGDHLDDLVTLIVNHSESRPLILGLEAPLFVPLREDLILATKARKGEGRRPWSAGAGAQVLAMNLPIMTYLFRHIVAELSDINFIINPQDFSGKPGEILIFEALVSGADKGESHIHDAQIMARYCLAFSQQKLLPPTILENESGISYFNLAAAALLQSGTIKNISCLSEPSPIYKPS